MKVHVMKMDPETAIRHDTIWDEPNWRLSLDETNIYNVNFFTILFATSSYKIKATLVIFIPFYDQNTSSNLTLPFD